MPRPSDLYANLGAPGVYQSTSWSPSTLPNVFLIPPAEDSQNIYCLFHSDSASSPAYEPFYGDPEYNRRDSSSSTVTHKGVLHQALSFFHFHAATNAGLPVFDQKPDWEHGEHGIMSSRSVGSSPYVAGSPRFGTSPGASATTFPNVRFLIEQERSPFEYQEDQIPASRRSSVFGERPSGHALVSESPSEKERYIDGTKAARGITLRSRAATALKAIGARKVRRTENAGRFEVGDEQGDAPSVNSKQHKRKSLVQLFGSSSSINISEPSPEVAFGSFGHPLHRTPSASNPKLTRRKSLTQRFGFARNSSETQTTIGPWESTPALTSSSPAPKLTKRKSVTRLFGLRGSASSTNLAARSSTSDIGSDTTTTAARLAALHALEGPVAPQRVRGIQPTQSAVTLSEVPDEEIHPTPPLNVDKTVTDQGTRKSLMRSHPFSFLDLHRRFTSHPASEDQSQTRPALPPVKRAVPEPPRRPSETTDSSSSEPTSMESDPDFEDTMQLSTPQSDVHSLGTSGSLPDENDDVDLSSSIRLDMEQKGSDTQWFDSLESGHLDVESSEEASSLRIPTRLESLRFEQLPFEPESFASAGRV